MKILILIPTYNESSNILDLLTAIVELKILGLNILVIDDNSEDSTGDVVRKFALNNLGINLLSRPKKCGIGSAYLDGFQWGIEREYDFFGQMDADFSHDPNDIKKLLEKLVSKKCDMVIGSRRVKGGKIIGWNRRRRLYSWLAHSFSRVVLFLPYKDTTSGFRFFSKVAINFLLASNIKSNGYAFQEEVLCKIHRAEFIIHEEPVIFRDRIRGKSKLGFREIFEFFILVFFFNFRR